MKAIIALVVGILGVFLLDQAIALNTASHLPWGLFDVSYQSDVMFGLIYMIEGFLVYVAIGAVAYEWIGRFHYDR